MHLQGKKLKAELFTTPDKTLSPLSLSLHRQITRSPSNGGELRKPFSKCIALSQLF